MGKTHRHDCDYDKKPDPRIPWVDIAGASRAVEENILGTLGEVPVLSGHELQPALDDDLRESFRDRSPDALQSMGGQALDQEIRLVA